MVTNKCVNGPLCWLIFLMDNIVKNIKFSHGFDKVWGHDQTWSSFSANVSECVCLFRKEYKKTAVGFIFLTIPRLGKRQSCIFELISVKAIAMFCGDHLMPKTPGSKFVKLLNAPTPKRVRLVGTFFKLNNGLGQVVIQFKKKSAQVQLVYV